MKNREPYVSDAATPAELDGHAAAWDALLPQCASASSADIRPGMFSTRRV